MRCLASACGIRTLLFLGLSTLFSISISPNCVAQGPPPPSPGVARIYIYRSFSPLPPGAMAFLNGEPLGEPSSENTYVIYDVEAPFPRSLSFSFQQLGTRVETSGCSLRPCTLHITKSPDMFTTKSLHLQVEAEKEYYVLYGLVLPGGLIDLTSEKRGAKDVAGLRLVGQKQIAVPTVEEAIGTVESELARAHGSDKPDCVWQQPLQSISVTEDGLQFTEAGKTDEGFLKKEFSVPVLIRFNGMPYLRISNNSVYPISSLNLRAIDFGTKPGFYAMPCVERLNTADPPRFIDAINRLIWNASRGGKQ